MLKTVRGAGYMLAARGGMRPGASGSLGFFWRLYLAGLVLLGLVAIANAVVGSLTGRRPDGAGGRHASPTSPPGTSPSTGTHRVGSRRSSARWPRPSASTWPSGSTAGGWWPAPASRRASASPSGAPLDEGLGLRPRTTGRSGPMRVAGEPSRLPARRRRAPTVPGRAGRGLHLRVAPGAWRSRPSRWPARWPAPWSGSPWRPASSAPATSRPAPGCGGATRWGSSRLAFDDMAGRLERLVRAERQLLADVSHELRTPLARIRVALDLAAEGDVARARQVPGGDPRRPRGAGAAARRRPHRGPARPGRGPGRRAAAAAAGPAPRRSSSGPPSDSATSTRARALTVRVEGTLPGLVADPAMLRRALDNLLDNAAKYSERAGAGGAAGRGATGRPSWSPSATRASASTRRTSPASSRPSSAPTAAGPAAPAASAWGSRSRKRIVEAHGGTIEVESRPAWGRRCGSAVPVET